MSWSVVEEFVESKVDGRITEDVIVTSEHFAAVIDGASDATGATFAGHSGGRFAAESIASSISSLGPHVTSTEFAAQLTAALRADVTDAVGTLDDTTRWPAACVLCLSLNRDEIWRIGDGNFSIDGEVNVGTKRVDDAHYGFRAAINAALIESGTPLEEILANDPGAQAARPLVDRQQHLSNQVTPWGYACVNGRPVPDAFVEIFSVAGAHEVVLASDGYPRLEPTLEASETTLRELLAADPAAIAELWQMGKSLRPGANSMDDRAYLRLRKQRSGEGATTSS